MAVLYRCFWLSNSLSNYRWHCETLILLLLFFFLLAGCIYVLCELHGKVKIRFGFLFCRCFAFMVAFLLTYGQLIRFLSISFCSAVVYLTLHNILCILYLSFDFCDCLIMSAYDLKFLYLNWGESLDVIFEWCLSQFCKLQHLHPDRHFLTWQGLRNQTLCQKKGIQYVAGLCLLTFIFQKKKG